jgi:hypothetical protein
MNKAIIQKAAMPLTDATDIDVPFSHLPIRSHCLLYFAE